MKISEWNNLRARLHHDWLQRYLAFLMARAEYMTGIVKENKTPREDILSQFLDWSKRAADFEIFMGGAESALSPAQLFEEDPLISMRGENSLWLRAVLHALYAQRTGIIDTIEKLRARFVFISGLHNMLTKILNGGNDDLQEKAGPHPFERLYKEIQEFSKMISSLPHEVQVV